MRSTGFFRNALLLAIACGAQLCGAQGISPHRDIRWPINCTNPGMAYNWQLNTCVAVGPVGNSGEVQINQAGSWYSLPGFSYDFVNNILTAPNITVPGTANLSVPAAKVIWPSSCATGVYVPATNTCVPTGTANNPAPPTGTLQMNSGGIFGPVTNSTADGSGNVTMQTLGSSVNRVLNVMAPPYNAKCDAVLSTNLTINTGTGTTSGFTFLAGDVGKTVNGITAISTNGVPATSNVGVPYSGTIQSVSGGSATLSPIPSSTLILQRWDYGTLDTAAIQAAFTDAIINTSALPSCKATGCQIYFPAGQCLTDTIVWKGQSFFGAGMQGQSTVLGMPGKDVFQTPDAPFGATPFTYVHDLVVLLDQSVDASNTAAGGNNRYPNRISGTYQNTTQYNIPITPGPVVFGGVTGCTGATVSLGTPTTMTFGCNGTNNFTTINPSRIVGSPVTIYGAGGTISSTGWQVTGNVITIQAPNSLSAGSTVLVSTGTTPTVQAGTIQTTATSTAVVGTGTTFLTTMILGAKIVVGGETRTVSAITDNFHLTTDAWVNTNPAGTAWSATGVGVFMNMTVPYTVLAANLSSTQFSIQLASYHPNTVPITENGTIGLTYSSTVAAIGNFTSNTTQSLTLSAPVTTAVSNAGGSVGFPNTPPWYLGNAGFALQCSNYSNCNDNATNWKFQNISIFPAFTTNFIQYNHTVGFFSQLALYASIFDNVEIQFFYAGYVEAGSVLPAAPSKFYATPDTWTAKDINIGSCEIGFVMLNGNDRVINGINIYGSGGVQSTGIWALGAVQPANPVNSSTPGGYTMSQLNSYYFEGTATGSGEVGRFQFGWYAHAANVTTGNGYINFLGSNGFWVGRVGTIKVYGNGNTFLNMTSASATTVTDTGQNNRFEASQNSAGPNSTMGRRFNPSARATRDPVSKMDASFLLNGNSLYPYGTLNDLLTTCDDWATAWVVAGTGTCVTDTSDFGTELSHIYYQSNSATGAFYLGGAPGNGWNNGARILGQNLLSLPGTAPLLQNAVTVPMTKVTVYVRARCVGATTNCSAGWYITDLTQGGNGSANGAGATTLTFTNNWSTQSWTTDLSTGVLGDVIGPRTGTWTNVGGTSYDVEWFAIVPVRTDPDNAPSWSPSTLYSVAGTPLPACAAANKGQLAVVSDATSPTYNGTYTGSGAVTVPVICNGSAWTTH